jgi:hypothetical protein
MITKVVGKAALVAVFLCLFGCASTFDSRIQDASLPAVPVLPVPKNQRYLIELNLFNTLAEVRHLCGISYAMACTKPFSSPCSIYAHSADFDRFIVHEIRHCTNGYWHKKLKEIK